jgi:Fe-S-cluster containining protein
MATKQIESPGLNIMKKKNKQDSGSKIEPIDLISRTGNVNKKLVGDTIQYKCQQCGNCCRMGYSIELSVDEMEFLTREHPQLKTVFAFAKGDYVRPFFNTGPKCSLLRNDHCGIYRDRPFECRYYPFHLVEVDADTPGAYEYGKKFYQLYVYENCSGLGKGKPWSHRKKDNFMKRILQEYVKHVGMLKITYKVLTTDIFFETRKQYGTGVIYGTDDEIREFLDDYQSKFKK